MSTWPMFLTGKSMLFCFSRRKNISIYYEESVCIYIRHILYTYRTPNECIWSPGVPLGVAGLRMWMTWVPGTGGHVRQLLQVRPREEMVQKSLGGKNNQMQMSLHSSRENRICGSKMKPPIL